MTTRRPARAPEPGQVLRAATWAIGVLALSGLACSRQGEASGPRPNVLLIMTDKLSLHALGHPDLRTPNIDAITGAGLSFRKAYSTAPACSPARASLVTGLMPHEAEVMVNSRTLKEGAVTLGELFQQAGYATAWAGKWHLARPFPLKDESIPGFEYLRLAKDPRDQTQAAALDTMIADEAVAYLGRPHDKPFLLAVSLVNPHDIVHDIRDPELVGNATEDLPPLPDNFAREANEPDFVRLEREAMLEGVLKSQPNTYWGERHWRGYLHRYHRLVETVDQQIGRVLDALRAARLEDSTLIVFTSDHGEGLAAHEWALRQMFYEEIVTVPLVFSWPGVLPEGAVDESHLVSGVDLVPTLCDFAGITAPATTGLSLRPVIEGGAGPGREYVVAQLLPDPRLWERRARMLRTQRYKYIAYSGGPDPAFWLADPMPDAEMLFDLQADPGETRNLAAQPDMASVLDEHRQLLSSWIRQTHDDFVMPGAQRD